MNLIDTLVEEFKRSLTQVFNKELVDKNYMKQTVLGCRWRAFWGITVAVYKSDMVKILALAIAEHRQKEHGENKTRTINTLSRSVSSSSSRSTNFWN